MYIFVRSGQSLWIVWEFSLVRGMSAWCFRFQSIFVHFFSVRIEENWINVSRVSGSETTWIEAVIWFRTKRWIGTNRTLLTETYDSITCMNTQVAVTWDAIFKSDCHLSLKQASSYVFFWYQNISMNAGDISLRNIFQFYIWTIYWKLQTCTDADSNFFSSVRAAWHSKRAYRCIQWQPL